MKLSISFLATGCQKLIEVDDELKLCTFCEKHMATDFAADALGEEWKGYTFQINGGNNKQGFPMKQGILTHGQVHLLLGKEYAVIDQGELGREKCKFVHSCIVEPICVLNLVIVKKGGERYSWSH
uniref:Small ribosomal subunit protein eS6 n=1 Tax=Pipistrellus kuhlii TaxID=59472 RepID=A0A7J8B2Y9_PIPKU|nr:hypothetical protein mPipKuh1_007898 [Pipistrellus kuhlii]